MNIGAQAPTMMLMMLVPCYISIDMTLKSLNDIIQGTFDHHKLRLILRDTFSQLSFAFWGWIG